ncbi:hypothetical protein [Nocardiopsis coralliicola]
MVSSTFADFQEAAENLSPGAVSQFLAAHNWQLEARQENVREVWRLRSVFGRPEGRVMLPLARGFVDFHRRFAETLEVLSHVHEVSVSELYERVVNTRADLFFLRLDQTVSDGTIPFKQAEATLQALLKMMKAAATTTADPTHSHRGRRPSVVTEFLEDDVRLGHTKQGGFVFTLVARHGSADSQSAHVGDDPLTPFTRQVMETLARGLETTQALTQSLVDHKSIFDMPSSSGLSAGLVESLEDIAQPDQLRQVDLSFEWAASGPRPTVGRLPIRFGRDEFGRLPVVKERLVRRDEPPQQATLVGSVRTLSRGEEVDGEEAPASVVLRTDVNGRERMVHMHLSGRDHDWAARAYMQKLPLTVSGELAYERRAWRLTNAVVDPSYYEFLERHPGEVTE